VVKLNLTGRKRKLSKGLKDPKKYILRGLAYHTREHLLSRCMDLDMVARDYVRRTPSFLGVLSCPTWA